MLQALSKEDNVQQILGWRPGPERAHLAWQLMHLGATDDRHLNVRMHQGEAKSPEFVRRFAGGSKVDDDIPDLAEIKQYVSDRRRDLLAHLRSLANEELANKPNEQAPWTYQEWFQMLAWHEAHHHGQAHLTLNMYKAQANA